MNPIRPTDEERASQNEAATHSATSASIVPVDAGLSQPPPPNPQQTIVTTACSATDGKAMSKSTGNIQAIASGCKNAPRIPPPPGAKMGTAAMTLAPIPNRKRSSKSNRKKCSSQQALLRAGAKKSTDTYGNSCNEEQNQQAQVSESRTLLDRDERNRYTNGENNYLNEAVGLSLDPPDHFLPTPVLSPAATNAHIANYVQNKLNSDLATFSSPTKNEKKQQSTLPKGEWKTVEVSHDSYPPPCQRSLHTGSLWKHYFLIFGGYSGDVRKNDFHWFNLETKKWSLVNGGVYNGTPPTPRDRHTAGVYNDRFYVFGGFDGTSRVNDFYEYNFATATWKQIPFNFRGNSESPPTPRHSHSAVIHKDSFYVFGGYDGSYRSDFHEYNFQTQMWRSIPPMGRCPRARYRATCTVHQNTMVLFGGHDGTRHLADMHIFDFVAQIWTAVIDVLGTPPVNRDSHLSVVLRNSLFVVGGSAGQALKDMHQLSLGCSDEDSEFVHTWSSVVCKGEMRHRFCHVGQIYDDNLYVFGGYDGSSRLNDFIRFEFNIDDMSPDIPPSTLVSDLKSLVNNEILSDVTFMIEGQYVHAHKVMLMRCEYFVAMLMGGMMEATQSVIHIEEVNYYIFLAVLEYLYTDELDISFEIAVELFVAADLFGIPRLQALCEKVIIQSIHIENAAMIFQAADMVGAPTLRSKALKYILKHFEAVSKSVAFEEMARSNVELIVEILKER